MSGEQIIEDMRAALEVINNAPPPEPHPAIPLCKHCWGLAENLQPGDLEGIPLILVAPGLALCVPAAKNGLPCALCAEKEKTDEQ